MPPDLPLNSNHGVHRPLLAIVTVFCNAIMAWLDIIGLKVNTPPVVALSVVGSASITAFTFSSGSHAADDEGKVLQAALRCPETTGNASGIHGLDHGCWRWHWPSPTQFQADMGLLLAFMFVTLAAIVLARAGRASLAQRKS